MSAKDKKIQQLTDALGVAWGEVRTQSDLKDKLLELTTNWQQHIDAEIWNSQQAHWECRICDWQSKGMADLTGDRTEPEHLDYAARAAIHIN